jgi:hypothetical protein
MNSHGRWFLAELAILFFLLANSVCYVWLADSFHENATRMIWCADEVTASLLDGKLLEWLGTQTYYPPLFHLYMGLCPFGTRLLSLPAMVLWSDLLMAAGFAGLAAGLRARHPAPAGAATLLLLLGFPLVNAYAKAPHFESSLLAITSGLLAVLCAAGALPGRAGCAALGVLAGAAVLCKWTAVLYLAGPLLVAAWFTARRPGGARPALEGLAAIGLVALALTGPWFYWCMDWERFGATLANTPTSAGVSGLAGYWLRLGLGFDYLAAATGSSLLPLVVAGCWLAFRRHPRAAALLAASAAVPVVILPVFSHIEIRYVAPALPALAALAGLGLASADASWRRLLLGLLLVLAPAQALDRTWMGAFGPCPVPEAGPQDSFDSRLQMSWDPSSTARAVVERGGHWAEKLRQGRGWMRFSGHPLEAAPGLKPSVFVTLQRRAGILETPLLFVDYAPHDYRTFVHDLAGNAFDFLVLSEQTLAVDQRQARDVVLSGWTYVPQGGAYSPHDEPPPLDDPLVLGRIRDNFGVVETLQGECGLVWLLVRRSLWEHRQAALPLTPLPPARGAP